MPNIRVMLWVALAAILYLNYEAWMHDYPAATPEATQLAGGSATSNRLGDSVPQSNTTAPSTAAPATSGAAAVAGTPSATTAQPAVPLGGAPPTALPASGSAAAANKAPDTTAASAAEPPLHVVTDVLDVAINLKGGELDRADILQYPLHKDTPNIPVRLLNRDDDTLYLLQTGLTGAAGEAAPTHLAIWKSAENSYVLPAGAAALSVPLTWTDGHGLTVTKTFTFKRGSYAVDLTYEVRNDGTAARSLAAYSQFLRQWAHASRSYFDVETYSFKGPAVFDGTKSRDLKVENETDSKFSETATNGWIASLQHHFVSAIVPEAGQPNKLQLQVQGHQYLLERDRADDARYRRAPRCSFTRIYSSDPSSRRNWRRPARGSISPPTTASSPSLRIRCSCRSSGFTASSATGAGPSSS